MTSRRTSLWSHHELITTLAWKSVVVRYKQAYLGLAWTVAKPAMMMVIFTVMRSFIGIDSGGVPYPVLAYCALMPWMFFQESASDGVNSVVGNAHLIKKVYFPRAIFPLTAVVTKLVELIVNLSILMLLMAWYGILPGVQALWIPVLIFYTVLVGLTVAFAGAAINVKYRDVGQMLPMLMSLAMYLSPVIYPLSLVKKRLLMQRLAGDHSEFLYTLYTANPLAGIIDAFQRVMLNNQPPDFPTMLPGIILAGIFLPISYIFFRRAESQFADVI